MYCYVIICTPDVLNLDCVYRTSCCTTQTKCWRRYPHRIQGCYGPDTSICTPSITDLEIRSIAQKTKWLDYELNERSTQVRFPARASKFSLLYSLQISSAVPPSLSMGARRSFSSSKAAGACIWHSPLYIWSQEWLEIYHHTPPSSWRGAQLNKGKFNLTSFILYSKYNSYFTLLF